MSGAFSGGTLLPEYDRSSAAGARLLTTGGVPITVIEPDTAARGGIVVLSESARPTKSIVQLLEALAAERWLVAVPDLFHRGFAAGVSFGDELLSDFDAAHGWLTEQRGVFDDCIGLLGFDAAGTAAFLVATQRPVGVAVSVAAPGISTPFSLTAPALVQVAPRLRAPWLGLYGADDPATPAHEVDQLRDAAAGAAVATLVVTFPGRLHRADQLPPDTGDGTDPATRIFDWFDSYLR